MRSELDKIWTRDKHPWSATLHGITEHCFRIVRHGTVRTNILMWHQHARERKLF
jgi:hypothetical protein